MQLPWKVAGLPACSSQHLISNKRQISDVMFPKACKRRHTLLAQVRKVVDDLPLLVDLPPPLAHEYEQTCVHQVQCTEDTISRNYKQVSLFNIHASKCQGAWVVLA